MGLPGYTTRTELPITHSDGAPADYVLRLELFEGEPTIESGTWTVDGNTYHHRLTKYVNEKSNAALEDIPVVVTVNTARLLTLGLTTSTGNEVRWCDEADDDVKVDFWLKDVPAATGWNTRETIYYVEIPDLSALETAHEIYMYFDEELGAVATDSDGAATFSLFDHFTSDDTGLWTTHDGVIGSSLCVITADGATKVHQTTATYAKPAIFECYSKENSTSATLNQDFTKGFGAAGADNVLMLVYNSAYYCQYAKSGVGATLTASTYARVADTYHEFKIVWTTDLVEQYVDGNAIVPVTTNVPAGPLIAQMRAYDNEAGSKVHSIDWVLARKTVFPEPEVYGADTLWCNGNNLVSVVGCTDFPNDIKFTDATDTNKLSYWIDRANSYSNQALFYVKHTADLTSNSTMYLYNGKADDADESTSTIFSSYQDWESDTAGEYIIGKPQLGSTYINDATIYLGRFAASENGTITHIAVNVAVACNVKVCVYADNAGEPAALAASSGSTAVIANSNPVFIALTVPLALTSGTYYWLGYTHDNAAHTSIRVHTDNGTRRYFAQAYASAFPDPWDTGTDTADATFTECITGWVLDTTPTSLTVESGDWAVFPDGLAQEPFAEDGMWNGFVFKKSATEYYCYSSSSWRNNTGISIMGSTDKTNWKFIRYIPLPMLATGQINNAWTPCVYDNTGSDGLYYMVFEGCVDLTGTYDLRIYYMTSSDLVNWTYGGVLYDNASNPYAPFLTNFGGTYYLYFVELGSPDAVNVASCATITGAYTKHVGAILSGTAGVLEIPRVYLDGETYYMFYNDYIVDPALASFQVTGYATSADPYDTFTDQGYLTYDNLPMWAYRTQYSPQLCGTSPSYELWITGREHYGHNADTGKSYDGMVGYATGTFPGGPWSFVGSQKAVRVFNETAALVSARTALSVADLAIHASVKGDGANTVAGVMWRAAADNSAYYAAYYCAADDKVYVKKSAWAAVTNAQSDFRDTGRKLNQAKQVNKDMRVYMDGESLHVYVNDVLLVDTTDASVADAGYLKLFTNAERGVFRRLFARPYSDPEPYVDGLNLVREATANAIFFGCNF